MKKKKIKILHVAQAAGGVDRYIRMLLKYLDKEKFENILVCSQDFREKDYKNLVDFFEQVKMDRAIGSNDLKAIGEVRRLIKRYNPDIVYAHSSKAGAIARVADIGLKNHCLYNPHGWAFNMRCSAKKEAMYTAIEKIAAPFCDKIICISDAEKQSALDKKICREDKLQVIFNGVDIEAYENGIHGTVKRKDLNGAEMAVTVLESFFEDGTKSMNPHGGKIFVYTKEKALDCFLFNDYLTPCVCGKLYSIIAISRVPNPKIARSKIRRTIFAAGGSTINAPFLSGSN